MTISNYLKTGRKKEKIVKKNALGDMDAPFDIGLDGVFDFLAYLY